MPTLSVGGCHWLLTAPCGIVHYRYPDRGAAGGVSLPCPSRIGDQHMHVVASTCEQGRGFARRGASVVRAPSALCHIDIPSKSAGSSPTVGGGRRIQASACGALSAREAGGAGASSFRRAAAPLGLLVAPSLPRVQAAARGCHPAAHHGKHPAADSFRRAFLRRRIDKLAPPSRRPGAANLAQRPRPTGLCILANCRFRYALANRRHARGTGDD